MKYAANNKVKRSNRNKLGCLEMSIAPTWYCENTQKREKEWDGGELVGNILGGGEWLWSNRVRDRTSREEKREEKKEKCARAQRERERERTKNRGPQKTNRLLGPTHKVGIGL